MPESMNLSMHSHYADVFDSRIHYVEQGVGNPILFLHGIPTSSYLWRNIIPVLAPLGHCIAPDLIGMGKSDKPDMAYTIEDHIRYIEEFIKVKKLKNVTLIMHGWGTLIGLDYAMRHESNCKGLVFYEGFLRSMCESDLSLPFQEQLAEFNEKEVPDLIDKIFPQSMLHRLTTEEIQHYRSPLCAKKVLSQYWHELPRGDGKSKADAIIARYSRGLMQSSLPKLLLYSLPGFMMTMEIVIWAKKNLPCLEIGDVGEELHFAQETQPELMAELISAWLQAVEQKVEAVQPA